MIEIEIDPELLQHTIDVLKLADDQTLDDAETPLSRPTEDYTEDALAIPALVTPTNVNTIELGDRNVTRTDYNIITTTLIETGPRTLIRWTDLNGTIHLIYPETTKDVAGTNVLWIVQGYETT